MARKQTPRSSLSSVFAASVDQTEASWPASLHGMGSSLHAACLAELLGIGLCSLNSVSTGQRLLQAVTEIAGPCIWQFAMPPRNGMDHSGRRSISFGVDYTNWLFRWMVSRVDEEVGGELLFTLENNGDGLRAGARLSVTPSQFQTLQDTAGAITP